MHGGFLLSIAREAAYQSDIRAGDRVLFATDMGWIMGPWTVVGAGSLGAAVVYMEGAPDRPDDRLWKLIEEERVTMLGVSPTLVRALIPKGVPDADLSSLRSITTTGEPWNAGPYDWLNEHVAGGGRIPIVNISGGTEVGACFLSVALTAPTKPVSLGFPALGQAMDVYSPEGEPLRGEVGELVCTRAWPGMTRGVWGDDERYLETYWRRFPGVWTHGDWASVDEDGYWFLHGRSDDTLNIAGKRIGPAELESAALDHPSVAEAAAIGVPHEVKGETAWIFVALKPGAEEDADGIKAAVAAVARQGVRTGADPLRLGAAEDALGQDRPPRRPGEGARRGSRRPFDPGEPRDPGGDRECRLEHWSPEAGRGIGAGHRARARRRRLGRHRHRPHGGAGRGGRGRDRRHRRRRRRLASARTSSGCSPRRSPIDLLVANAGVALWEESPGRPTSTSGGTCSR